VIPCNTPRCSDNPGICLAAGVAATVAALLVAGALAIDPERALLIVAAAVAASSVRVPLAVAAGIGALAWGLYTGFVVHQYGELAAEPADVGRAVLLIGTGLLTAAATGRHRPLTTR
jgi:hypothetical protein